MHTVEGEPESREPHDRLDRRVALAAAVLGTAVSMLAGQAVRDVVSLLWTAACALALGGVLLGLLLGLPRRVWAGVLQVVLPSVAHALLLGTGVYVAANRADDVVEWIVELALGLNVVAWVSGISAAAVLLTTVLAHVVGVRIARQRRRPGPVEVVADRLAPSS